MLATNNAKLKPSAHKIIRRYNQIFYLHHYEIMKKLPILRNRLVCKGIATRKQLIDAFLGSNATLRQKRSAYLQIRRFLNGDVFRQHGETRFDPTPCAVRIAKLAGMNAVEAYAPLLSSRPTNVLFALTDIDYSPAYMRPTINAVISSCGNISLQTLVKEVAKRGAPGTASADVKKLLYGNVYYIHHGKLRFTRTALRVAEIANEFPQIIYRDVPKPMPSIG